MWTMYIDIFKILMGKNIILFRYEIDEFYLEMKNSHEIN